MKKINVALYGMLTIGVLCNIQGCSFKELDNAIKSQQDKPEIEFELPTQIMELQIELPIEIASDEIQENETTEEIIEVSDIYYAYHKLDNTKQKIYMEIFNALDDYKEEIMLSTTDKGLIDEVFTCVMNDHPELFYVDGYKCTEYSLNNKITDISFGGTYSMTYEEVIGTKNQIDEVLEPVLREVPLNEDEYYTIKYIYEFLINNTEYNKAADNNQNICSVFLQGESVCQGYAKAMQYMLHKMDMQAFLVTGFTNGERHAWNLVKVNGQYYYTDPTWGDASYFYNGETVDANGTYSPQINYDYFLVTTDEITRTHSVERVVELPECISIENDYFYREGLYFESYDDDKLKHIFEYFQQSEDGYVTIKCSNKAIYDEMLTKLIKDKAIFDFLDNHGDTIAYTSNEKQETISFWKAVIN